MFLRFLVGAIFVFISVQSFGFCGFYVAKADTTIFNKASKVVLVRDGDRTVLTMVNDFKGDLKEFAIVVPVPTPIEREQIHVGDKAAVDHLDAFSSPRLVEYFDPNPCEPPLTLIEARGCSNCGAAHRAMSIEAKEDWAKSLGVKIEAQYTVGEYDIMILSAQQSEGLVTWLNGSGYKMPKGAKPILESYINQNMKFFVAKVNLKEQKKTGFTYLRPLQVAYESPKFMLPIRLGTVNADGPQELYIMALTRNGRVETTNYRTVKIPSEKEIPTYIKNDFTNFYRAMFEEQVRRENMKVVFLEYAWDMGWCDPCAADPLTPSELRQLGVFWVQAPSTSVQSPSGLLRKIGQAAQPMTIMPSPSLPTGSTFVTRLHVRYDAKTFPEDLIFQETQNKENFQGRYILRHPFKGELNCNAGEIYKNNLTTRFEQEAKTLASLTGWDINEIRQKHKIPQYKMKKWYQDLWGN